MRIICRHSTRGRRFRPFRRPTFIVPRLETMEEAAEAEDEDALAESRRFSAPAASLRLEIEQRESVEEYLKANPFNLYGTLKANPFNLYGTLLRDVSFERREAVKVKVSQDNPYRLFLADRVPSPARASANPYMDPFQVNLGQDLVLAMRKRRNDPQDRSYSID